MSLYDKTTSFEGSGEIDAFLLHYRMAQEAMRKAADALHAFSKSGINNAARRNYDRTHKQMLRVMRDWNQIEHTRERALGSATVD